MRPHPQFVARVFAVAVIAADLAASPKLRGAEVVRPAGCFEEGAKSRRPWLTAALSHSTGSCLWPPDGCAQLIRQPKIEVPRLCQPEFVERTTARLGQNSLIKSAGGLPPEERVGSALSRAWVMSNKANGFAE